MRPRGFLLPALAALVAACAPTYHVPPAYRHDRPRAEALEARAVEACRLAVGPEGVPRRTFVSDGCTLWPDGLWTGSSWQECCIDHDIAYWCGGPAPLRSDADRALDQCVDVAYAGYMGSLMRVGTWALGGRLVPAHWRWGYGHDYPAPD